MRFLIIVIARSVATRQSFVKVWIAASLTLLAMAAEAYQIRDSISWSTNDNKTGTARCYDGGRICLESGTRIVEGVEVSRACWRYGYKKTCDFPSKSDCNLLAHCYEVGLKECLMWDSFRNCVNQKKEFSCKRREIFANDREKIKQNLNGDEAKRIVCKGIPCIDGNCVDKSYDMDADMMKSTSQLYAVSRASGSKDMNFELFKGFAQHCAKKPTGYMSCCKVKGWGEHLGASCNADEKRLHDLRVKNLCVYACKETTGTAPFHTNKHHFCCFGNILNKVFQMEARKQLGMTFKIGEKPDCRGLTLNEVMKLDFEKMDFSEFALDIKKKMKLPNISDMQSRVSGAASTMRGSVNEKTVRDDE